VAAIGETTIHRLKSHPQAGDSPSSVTGSLRS
jgi:hypothetical protein